MTKALLIASTGGHLAQLVRLAPSFGISEDSTWVTFRTPQSESLLAGKDVVYVPYVKPRDVRGTLRVSLTVAKLLRTRSFDLAISTGAAPAVGALPLARAFGVRTVYVESVSRVVGPSLSGRLIALSGAAEMFTQHMSWSNAKWKLHPSVFSTYASQRRPETSSPRLFVTLGTIKGFRFDALIDAVLSTGLADSRTVWQLGDTWTERALPGRVFEQVSSREFDQFASEADVVVTHSGVGTLLGLMQQGIYPVVAVRRSSRNEHVDDHQEQIAKVVGEAGIASAVEVDQLCAETLVRASGFYTVPGSEATLV